jgi:hypothetical protein
MTGNMMDLPWAKEAYTAMLLATAVSDVSIADGFAELQYRPMFVRLAKEALAEVTMRPEAYDGFDPSDLAGLIARLVEFDRRSTKAPSCTYRDLVVDKRQTEIVVFDTSDAPLLKRTLVLLHDIEEGRRTREVANLKLLASYERCLSEGSRLNAVITLLEPSERAAGGLLHGVPVAIKDNIDVRGIVTTNSSTVGVPPRLRTTRTSSCGCGRRVWSFFARRICSSTQPAASTRPTG